VITCFLFYSHKKDKKRHKGSHEKKHKKKKEHKKRKKEKKIETESKAEQQNKKPKYNKDEEDNNEEVLFPDDTDIRDDIRKTVQLVITKGKAIVEAIRIKDPPNGKFAFLNKAHIYYPYYQLILKKAVNKSVSPTIKTKKQKKGNYSNPLKIIPKNTTKLDSDENNSPEWNGNQKWNDSDNVNPQYISGSNNKNSSRLPHSEWSEDSDN